MPEEVKPLSKDDIDYAKVFNIKVWEGIQYKLAKVLGITIKVISEDNKIETEETNFNEFCELVRGTEKGALACKELRVSETEKGAKFIKCKAAGFTHYCASTYFYGKRFNILIGIKGDLDYDKTVIKKISDDYGIDAEKLIKSYKSMSVVSEEKIISLTDLILDLFNIVVELSVQQYTIHRANKEKEEEISKMSALMEASIVINSTRNLQQLLRIIMQSAERVMQAEASSVFLIDSEKNELYFEVATGPKEKEVKEIRLKMGEGIAGYVAYTGESLLVPDVSKDPRFARRVDEQTHFITRSAICVPLKVRNQIIGVVQVLNKIGGTTFSKTEIKFLEALASQAAIAIENTNLYEHLEERAEQLNKELKEANINLSIEKRRIESMVQSMQDAVLAIDKGRKITMMNRIAEKIFDINAGEAFNKFIGDYVKNKEIIDNFNLVLTEKNSTKGEVKFMLGSKEHIFAAVFAPIISESQEAAGSVAVLRDITELKELDKMKTEFLNMVSHELRTPLTPIQAYSELMMTRNMEGEKIKDYAGIINKETQRLGALIGDLLDLSRVEAGKGLSLELEEVDPVEIIKLVYDTFKNSSSKHKFILTIPEKSEKIMIDRNKIIQVITNLLSNAVKYSPDGGNITIIFEDKGNRVYVRVKDEGIGLAKEHIDQVFDKFYRVPSETVKKISGTGIGLTIVKYILELHNGGIAVESEEGKGSTFSFYLPKVKSI